MSRSFTLSCAIIASVGFSFLLSACSGPSAVYDKSESHFNFPNSSALPEGQVKAVVSKTSIMFPEIGSPDLEQEAVQTALSQKPGAINLINGRYYWTTKYVDILIPIYTTTLVVEGEAARVDLGRQVRQPTDPTK